MSRIIFCHKQQQEAEGLEKPPFPGEEGQKIFEQISQKVWLEWLGYQTILINEYRLSSIDPKAKLFLAEERDKFLFGEGIELPEQFNAIE